MATKISALTSADDLDRSEVLPVVQDGATRQATIEQIAAAVLTAVLPEQHGALGDGINNDTQAIKDAITAAGTTRWVYLTPGKTYKVDPNEVKFAGPVMATGATVTCGATGVALQVGSGSVSYADFEAHLPHVTFTGTANLAGSVGVRLAGIVNSKVWVGRIKNFETNLHCTPGGAGLPSTYSDVYIDYLDGGKVNLLIDDGEDDSYCNEINWWGGRYARSGSATTGAHHIKMVKNGTWIPNNHRWYGASLEGNGHEANKTVVCGGYSNFWHHCRWEADDPGIEFVGSSAGNNVVFFGYGSEDVVFSVASGTPVGNKLYGNNTLAIEGQGADGVVRLSNQDGYAFPSLGITQAADHPADASEVNAVDLSAGFYRGRNPSDADVRIELDNYNGRIRFGDGTNAVDVEVRRWAANTAGLAVGDAWRLGTTTTANRPAAATVGAGAIMFDTTVGKIIVSTGSAWEVVTSS
jgi:hypothetical protein